MNVLIITYSEDNETVELVSKHLKTMGARAFRFDTDRYPTQHNLSLGYGEGCQQKLTTDEGTLSLDEVDAIWYRRVRVGSDIPKDMDPQLRRPSIEESNRSFRGMLASSDAFVLDPLPYIRHAENKQLQLKVAREVGLRIPDTLISNDPEAVQAFADAHPNGIITKMMTAFAVYSEGEEQVVFTNKLTDEDLADLSGLNYCPMTFQEHLVKKLEHRVTVVGRQIFSAAIDSTGNDKAENDWRKDGDALIDAWVPTKLPDTVEAAILRLMDRFGLNYGAMDIIQTHDDQYYFLEVNPCGEWFWLELYAKLPIGKAIAEVLLGRQPRRDGHSGKLI